MTANKSQAIQTALMGDWNAAVGINQTLLKENPKDIDTLNRLAFALIILGRGKEAKNAYQKVLLIDKKNPIALRNLRRLAEIPMREPTPTKKVKKSSKTKNGKKSPQAPAILFPVITASMTNLFLEESGKTKIVELVNVAEPKIVSMLLTGQSLDLRVKRLKVFVLDAKNTYIGMLPDNIAKRLIEFLKGGNCYQTYIKSIQSHKICVFIKESKRATRFKNQPSFSLGEKGKVKIEKHTTSKYQEDQKEDDESEED